MITCPRCQAKVKLEKKEMPVAGKMLEVSKYTCIECDTAFYFEEQIVTYLVLKSVEKSK